MLPLLLLTVSLSFAQAINLVDGTTEASSVSGQIIDLNGPNAPNPAEFEAISFNSNGYPIFSTSTALYIVQPTSTSSTTPALATSSGIDPESPVPTSWSNLILTRLLDSLNAATPLLKCGIDKERISSYINKLKEGDTSMSYQELVDLDGMQNCWEEFAAAGGVEGLKGIWMEEGKEVREGDGAMKGVKSEGVRAAAFFGGDAFTFFVVVVVTMFITSPFRIFGGPEPEIDYF